MLPSLLAQATAEPSLLDLGGVFLSALSGGKYALLGAVSLLALVLVARKVGAKYVPWLATPRGGAVLSVALTTLTPLVAQLGNGVAFSAGLIVQCLLLGLSASGLWSVGKNVVTPPPLPEGEAKTRCTPIEIANGTCKP